VAYERVRPTYYVALHKEQVLVSPRHIQHSGDSSTSTEHELKVTKYVACPITCLHKAYSIKKFCFLFPLFHDHIPSLLAFEVLVAACEEPGFFPKVRAVREADYKLEMLRYKNFFLPIAQELFVSTTKDTCPK